MEIKLTIEIDKSRLIDQLALIDMLVENVSDDESETVYSSDLNDLFGIQGILEDVFKYADYKPCINENAIADLARETIEGWDLEGVMESAESALIDFWCSPEGVDDLADRIAYKNE